MMPPYNWNPYFSGQQPTAPQGTKPMNMTDEEYQAYLKSTSNQTKGDAAIESYENVDPNRINTGQQYLNPYAQGDTIYTEPLQQTTGINMQELLPAQPVPTYAFSNPKEVQVPVLHGSHVLPPPGPPPSQAQLPQQDIVEPFSMYGLPTPDAGPKAPEVPMPTAEEIAASAGYALPKGQTNLQSGFRMPTSTGSTMINFQNPYVAPQPYDMNNIMPEVLRGQQQGEIAPGGGVTTKPLGGFNAASTMIDFTNKSGEAPVTQEPPTDDTTLVDNTGTTKEDEPATNPDGTLSTTKIQPLGPGQITTNPYTPKVDVPNFDVPKYDTLKPEDKAEIEMNAAKQGMTPEKYYALKGAWDAALGFNAIVQPPPPTLQYALTHYNRMRMDDTPLVQGRENIKQQGAASLRAMREGTSQISDLMKGVNAVAAGMGSNMAQLGATYNQQSLATEQYNQGISNTEQQGISQTNNLNADRNLEIKAAGAAAKADALTKLTMAGQSTLGEYAKYIHSKEERARLEAKNEEQVEKANRIQTMWLKQVAGQAELNSPQYQSTLLSGWNQSLKDKSLEMMQEEGFENMRTKYGDTAPSYSTYLSEAYSSKGKMMNQIVHAAKTFEQIYPDGVGPDETKFDDPLKYAEAKRNYDEMNKIYEQYKSDPTYKAWEEEQKFWVKMNQETDYNKYKGEFADQYLRDKGLYTNIDFTKELEALMSGG